VRDETIMFLLGLVGVFIYSLILACVVAGFTIILMR